MIATATSTNIYLPLFGGGGTAAPPKNGLTWGLETLDVFQRPISSANPVLATEQTLYSTKPIDPLTGLALGSYGFEDDGYFDWVNEMIAFREAARLNAESRTDNTAPDQGGETTSTEGSSTAEAGATGGDTGTATETTAQTGDSSGNGSTSGSTTSGGSGGSGSSGGGSTGGGGLFGWLVG